MLHRVGNYFVKVMFLKLPKDTSSVIDKMVERLFDEAKPAECQVFDAEKIVDERHVLIAFANSYLAFKSNSNIARKLSIELLVRLSAQDQINKAIEMVGVKEGTRILGVCVFGGEEEKVIEGSEKVKRLVGGEEVNIKLLDGDRVEKVARSYGIPESFIKTVQSESKEEAILLLISEKVACSDLYR